VTIRSKRLLKDLMMYTGGGKGGISSEGKIRNWGTFSWIGKLRKKGTLLLRREEIKVE